MPEPEAVAQLIEMHDHYLHAISCGAVFMGANTYIGNAPNFMVKSIAEEAGIKMPSFFGYMFRYSHPDPDSAVLDHDVHFLPLNGCAEAPWQAITKSSFEATIAT